MIVRAAGGVAKGVVVVIPNVRHDVDILDGRQIETGAQESFLYRVRITKGGVDVVRHVTDFLGIVRDVAGGQLAVRVVLVNTDKEAQRVLDDGSTNIGGDGLGDSVGGINTTTCSGGFRQERVFLQGVHERFDTDRQLGGRVGNITLQHLAAVVPGRRPVVAVVVCIEVEQQVLVKELCPNVAIEPLEVVRKGFGFGRSTVGYQQVITKVAGRGVENTVQTGTEVVRRRTANIGHSPFNGAVAPDNFRQQGEGRRCLLAEDEVRPLPDVVPADVGELQVEGRLAVGQQVAVWYLGRSSGAGVVVVVFIGQQEFRLEAFVQGIIKAKINTTGLEGRVTAGNAGVLVGTPTAFIATVKGAGRVAMSFVIIVHESVAPQVIPRFDQGVHFTERGVLCLGNKC